MNKSNKSQSWQEGVKKNQNKSKSRHIYHQFKNNGKCMFYQQCLSTNQWEKKQNYSEENWRNGDNGLSGIQGKIYKQSEQTTQSKDSHPHKNPKQSKKSQQFPVPLPSQQFQKLTEKQLKTQLDSTELKLKNRNESLQVLHLVVNQKLFNIINKIYNQHCQILSAQAARIVLLIYSHYPVRDKLYISHGVNSKWKNVGNQGRISYIILPLLLHNYTQVNQSAAIECMQGLIKEGGVNIVQNFSMVPFYKLSTNSQINNIGMVVRNVSELTRKWGQNPSSPFLNGVLQLISSNIASHYKKPPLSFQNIQNIYDLLLKQLTIQLTTKLTTIIPLSNSNTYTIININRNVIREIIINIFQHYIHHINGKFKYQELKGENYLCKNQEMGLIYMWAIFSICENIPYVGKNGKNCQCANYSKSIFVDVIANAKVMITANGCQKQQKQSQNYNQVERIQTKNQHQYINLALSLIYPFEFQSTNYQLKSNSLHIDSNQCKLLVIVKYQQLFLYIINNFNIQDNIEEGSIGMIVHWVFQLAVYCDEMKKKHKLEIVLNNIASLGIVNEGCGVEKLQTSSSTSNHQTNQLNLQYGFDKCQSILYKLLISIQKSLPKYSLKYYSNLYIDRPGIFHLYFIDQILIKCQILEIKNFMIDLVQKWINIEMRDFNMLGYVCKFMLYFLNGNNKLQKYIKIDDGYRILLSFFREVKYQTLIHLNTIFYQASFSDSTAPQTQVNHYNIQNTCKLQLVNSNSLFPHSRQSLPQNQPQPLILPPNLPPLTLSSYQQQSEIKSCGYSYSQKTVFLDRYFYMPEELLYWGSTLLHQIYDDHYYYHCKYFYYLLTSAYSIRESSTKIATCGQKNIKDTKSLDKAKIATKQKQRQSLSSIQLFQQLNANITKIISFWQQCIIKNKISTIYSIFQMLMCWGYAFIPTMNNHQLSIIQNNKIQHVIKQQNIKQIFRIILHYHQKLLSLPLIYTHNWKQAIKQMQNNAELFDKYKKQQNKVKNRQAYLLRSIVKFIQNLSTNKIYQLVPKNMTYQQIIEIIQKYSVYSGGIACWRSMRVLSSRASRNIFLEQALKVINGTKTQNINLKGNKKRLQLYRELLFTYIQQYPLSLDQITHPPEPTITKSKSAGKQITNIKKINKGNIVSNNNIKYSQELLHSENQRSGWNHANVNNINRVIEFELKINIIDMISQCISILSDTITQNKQQNKLYLKNDKQQLYNKHIILQILQQLYRKPPHMITNLKVISHIMNASKQLNNTILAILFRDCNIVTRYQRKLILSLREMCLNWVTSNQCLESCLWVGEVLKMRDWGNRNGGEVRNVDGVFHKRQVYLTLWHCALDEEIQLRILVISILTNIYKSDSFSWLKKQWYWYCAILTLIKALEPKQKLKIYVQKCIQHFYSKMVEKYQSGMGGFILNLGLVIGFLVFNSKVNLPCVDIFEGYCESWLKGNKDICYLIISALEIVEREGFKFRQIEMGGRDGELGKDLKLFYMDVKKKRGWIMYRPQIQYPYVELQSKSEAIFKYLKDTIFEKVKNAKYLKARKDCIFDIGEILKIGDIVILQRLSDQERKMREEKREKNNTGFENFKILNVEINDNSEEEQEIDLEQLCDFQ